MNSFKKDQKELYELLNQGIKDEKEGKVQPLETAIKKLKELITSI